MAQHKRKKERQEKTMNLEELGLPKAKINQFKDREIETVYDLATYFPKEYYDFRKPTHIQYLIDGKTQCVFGKIIDIKALEKMAIFKVQDQLGKVLSVPYFKAPYVAKKFEVGNEVVVAGKVKIDPQYGPQIANPFLMHQMSSDLLRIYPVYKKIPRMSDAYLTESIEIAKSHLTKEEKLEESLLSKFNLIEQHLALEWIHKPQTMEQVDLAKKRVLFDQLFHYAMQMEYAEREINSSSPIAFQVLDKMVNVMKSLPFELTKGQADTLRSILQKTRNGKRVNAMVQGDVGCGKTIIAILLMIAAAENGYQSIMMAPTNVLGKQHYEDIIDYVKGTGIKVAYLSGETKVKERRKILEGMKDGTIDILVGTHAVIGKDVECNQLGLTIVDEEHRFGVQQRNDLRNKSKNGIHHINMSATPIPRSLALATFGDSVDVFSIKQLPKGRKPVRTVLLTESERACNGILQQVEKGHQAYVVCPLIEESENEVLDGVESVEEAVARLTTRFKAHPSVKIGMISGKMKPKEVAEVLEQFSSNEINVLVSTTIIEVGVNVPNSTIILIQNAERFGLAQLHQLRGRVGRSDLPSYCILLSTKYKSEKLQAMVDSTDGFVIAEKDMEIRGTGDFTGFKQSGLNQYVELIKANYQLYVSIQQEVKQIYTEPNRLRHYSKQSMIPEEVLVG